MNGTLARIIAIIWSVLMFEKVLKPNKLVDSSQNRPHAYRFLKIVVLNSTSNSDIVNPQAVSNPSVGRVRDIAR